MRKCNGVETMHGRKLKAYVRALELGSITKAGEELGYTQSGISHMLKSLEEEVGFSLLERRATGVSATPEGASLLPAIRDLLQTREVLDQHISIIRGLEIGHIRIAAFTSVAIQWLPPIVKKFQKSYPGITIQITEAGSSGIGQCMKDRSADLSFFTGWESEGFDWTPLCHDRMLVVLPEDHRLAGAEAFPLQEMSQERFIAPMEDFNGDIHQVVDRLLVAPDIQLTSSSDYAIMTMVGAGLGITVLPELIVKSFQTNVVSIPLDPPFWRTLGYGKPSGQHLSPASKAFLQYVRDYVTEHHREDLCVTDHWEHK